jgi:hypothetical protein
MVAYRQFKCAGALRHSTRVIVAGGGRRDIPQNIHACHKQEVLSSEQPGIADRVQASKMHILRARVMRRGRGRGTS